MRVTVQTYVGSGICEALHLIFDVKFSFLDICQGGQVRLKFSFFVLQLRLE